MVDKQRLLQIINQKSRGITVIIGLSKNAGKSTFLNWLLENNSFLRTGVITTGRDGEEYDTIENVKTTASSNVDGIVLLSNERNFPKPRIIIPPDTLFTTRSDIIRRNSYSLQILEKLSSKAGGEPLWIVKALSGLETEIVGPPSVTEQVEIAEKLLQYGAEHVFIDGSLDRKAIASSALISNLIIVAGAQTGSLNTIVSEIKQLLELASIQNIDECFPGSPDIGIIEYFKHFSKSEIAPLPVVLFVTKPDEGISSQHHIHPIPLSYNTLIGNEKELLNQIHKSEYQAKYIYLPASLTERSFTLLKETIHRRNIGIIIEHPYNILLSDKSFKSIAAKLSARRTINVTGIALNSFAPNGNHLDCEKLRAAVRNEFSLPVVDVMESL